MATIQTERKDVTPVVERVYETTHTVTLTDEDLRVIIALLGRCTAGRDDDDPKVFHTFSLYRDLAKGLGGWGYHHGYDVQTRRDDVWRDAPTLRVRKKR